MGKGSVAPVLPMSDLVTWLSPLRSHRQEIEDWSVFPKLQGTLGRSGGRRGGGVYGEGILDEKHSAEGKFLFVVMVTSSVVRGKKEEKKH